MFLTRALLAIGVAVFLGGNLSAQMPAPSGSNPAFDQLKPLAGTWEGTNSQKLQGTVVYEVVSGGSVLMERLHSATETEMVTMYTLEGNSLVVTHYCSMGNQPTMQTGPVSGATSKYDFHFVRVAGTKTPDEGHMLSLAITMPDKNHLTQVWTFEDHGKTNTEVFNFTRKL
jgi:hypothetical protein